MADMTQRGGLTRLALKRQLIAVEPDILAAGGAQVRAQERSQVAAARNRRQVVDLRQQIAPGKRYEHAERECGGANPAARQRQRHGMRLVDDFRFFRLVLEVMAAARFDGHLLGGVDCIELRRIVNAAEPLWDAPRHRLAHFRSNHADFVRGARAGWRWRTTVAHMDEQIVKTPQHRLETGEFRAKFISCIECTERPAQAFTMPFRRERPYVRVEHIPRERIEMPAPVKLVYDLARRLEQREHALQRRLLVPLQISKHLRGNT